MARDSVSTDFSQGKPVNTGSALDLSIGQDGFFVVRSGERILYTRQGQFVRDGDGRLTTGQGLALQSRDGGDVIVRSEAFEVLPDGMVIEDGAPVAQIAVMDFADRSALVSAEGSAFAADDLEGTLVDMPQIRQGMIESSNLSTGDEMIAIMEALRRAESGQRVVTIYDDLMGRALTAFGQG